VHAGLSFCAFSRFPGSGELGSHLGLSVEESGYLKISIVQLALAVSSASLPGSRVLGSLGAHLGLSVALRHMYVQKWARTCPRLEPVYGQAVLFVMSLSPAFQGSSKRRPRERRRAGRTKCPSTSLLGCVGLRCPGVVQAGYATQERRGEERRGRGMGRGRARA
jgi:hypothetical protein